MTDGDAAYWKARAEASEREIELANRIMDARWVSVTDALPPVGTMVLFAFKFGEEPAMVCGSLYPDGTWHNQFGDDLTDVEVSLWMYLPSLPKRGETS